MCRPTVILRLRHGEARRISERTKADLKLRLKGCRDTCHPCGCGLPLLRGTNACSRRERHASRQDSGSHSQPAHAAANRRSRYILTYSERKPMQRCEPRPSIVSQQGRDACFPVAPPVATDALSSPGMMDMGVAVLSLKVVTAAGPRNWDLSPLSLGVPASGLARHPRSASCCRCC